MNDLSEVRVVAPVEGPLADRAGPVSTGRRSTVLPGRVRVDALARARNGGSGPEARGRQ
ncbi:MAG: hypothetical protein SFY95_06315 [Planctomycetota bacterium]|nr:hypothetical protein [Planctomycetota bacterium]